MWKKRKRIPFSDRLLGKPDRGFFFLTLILTFLGIIAVADASSPQALATFSDPFYFVKQQIIWSLLGVGILIGVSFVPYFFWRKVSLPIFLLSLFLLILVLIPGAGTRILGARRWLNLGPLSFQPSEFVKLSLAMFLAKIVAEDRRKWIPALVILIVAILIMLQPDFGTTIVVVGMAFGQLFLGGFPILYFLGAVIFGGLMGTLLIFFSDYRRARLQSFLQSSIDPLGSSYHIRQILYALGSGGILGVGIGQSKQKHLFLPETATDSVFAIVAEEVGFLGSLVILLLIFFFIYKSFKIAYNAPDRFSQLLAGGVAIWFGIQSLLNLGSIVAIIPITGVPIPFFSYGGSSLTMVLVSAGILLNISKYKEKKLGRNVRR